MPAVKPPDARPPVAVGWMRFVGDGERGFRAALLQTSVRGRPRAFCFTRMGYDALDVKPARGAVDGSGGRTIQARLASWLLRAAHPPPVLALVMAGEYPASPLAVHEPDLGVPLRRIRAGTIPAVTASEAEAGWETEDLSGGYDTEWTLGAVLDAVDPIEVFDRTARGLAEAFTDSSVRTLATIPGLTTMVHLAPLRERLPGVGDHKGGGKPSLPAAAGEGRPLTLAERLWAVLFPQPGPPVYDPGIRLDWTGELMPFQQDGVRALLREKRLLLADDMGLGKTVQVIAALRILRAQQRIGSCLVVAPAAVLDQWRREIEKWASELTAIIIRGAAHDRAWQWKAKVDIILVSYDTLRSDGDVYRVRWNTWDVVVADEAQRIKNRNDTSDLLKRLRRRRSWALSGTPLENREEELASIMEFVDHAETGPPRRYHPGEALRERHREFQLRRKKNEVLPDLPAKQVTKILIELTRSQRRSYLKAEEEGIVFLKSLGAEAQVRHVFELVTRLKQICNADPETGESSKLEDVRERMEQLTQQGHRALVFSQYTSESYGVRAAAGRLREFAPLVFTGDIPEPERGRIIGSVQDPGGAQGAGALTSGRRRGLEPAGGVLRVPPGSLVESCRGTPGRGSEPSYGPDRKGQCHQVLLHRYYRRTHRPDPGAEAGPLRPAHRRRIARPFHHAES